MEDFTYKFGAVLGSQNGRPFYQATVPFRALASMLKLDDDFDVNKRSQRLVEKPRAKKVAKYLEKNKDGFWVLTPLVGFIEGDYKFEQLELDGWGCIGRMHVPIDSRIMLFDGQHRAFGIKQIMTLLPEFGMENISIMFVNGMTLSERQQAFHDINHTQKTPAAALCIAYNDRNDIDKMVVETFSNSSIRALIEYEKNTVSGTSDKIYSLKTLKDFALNVIGKNVEDDSQAKLQKYTDALFEVINIPGILAYLEQTNQMFVKHGWVAQQGYRRDYILGHAVTVKALGLLGKHLLENNSDDLEDILLPLKDKSIFVRGHENWEHRCVSPHDKMVSNQLAVRLTFYKLKELCGIALDENEKAEERIHFEQLEDAA